MSTYSIVFDNFCSKLFCSIENEYYILHPWHTLANGCNKNVKLIQSTYLLTNENHINAWWWITFVPSINLHFANP